MNEEKDTKQPGDTMQTAADSSRARADSDEVTVSKGRSAVREIPNGQRQPNYSSDGKIYSKD
jgi:hypothetical protein